MFVVHRARTKPSLARHPQQRVLPHGMDVAQGEACTTVTMATPNTFVGLVHNVYATLTTPFELLVNSRSSRPSCRPAQLADPDVRAFRTHVREDFNKYIIE